MGIVFSQQSQGLRHEVEQKCRSMDTWTFFIKSIRNEYLWTTLVDTMFNDQIFNEPRLEVLDIVTEDVTRNLIREGLEAHAEKINERYCQWKMETFKKHIIESVDSTTARLKRELKRTREDLKIANIQLKEFQKMRMDHINYMFAWQNMDRKKTYNNGEDQLDSSASHTSSAGK